MERAAAEESARRWMMCGRIKEAAAVVADVATGVAAEAAANPERVVGLSILGGAGAALYYYPGYTLTAAFMFAFAGMTRQGGAMGVRTGNQTQVLYPQASDSVEAIKAKIQEREPLPPGQQRMVFTGSETNTDEIHLETASADFLINFFANSSVEELFHYIRFGSFASSTDEQKKEVIKALSHVSCGVLDTTTSIITFVKADDIAGLLAFAKTRAENTDVFIDEVEESGLNVLPVKDVDEIIDIYFQESDPRLSLRVLQTLLFFDIVDDGTIYKNYVSKLRNMESKDKEFATCSHFEHSFII